MAQKGGLGKGLGALIPTWEDEPSRPSGQDQVMRLPIGSISPNPQQPRKEFDQANLEDLAESIREHGIIQPLIVVAGETGSTYTLIAGERRLRAAKLAGLTEVPAIVRTATEQEQLEFAIIENVQREDLNPLERAQAYQNLVNEFSLTHEDIARRVGKNRATITNTLRLLNLPEAARDALRAGDISEGHARSLLSLGSERAMEAALDTILQLGLNVRQAELLVSKLSGKVPRRTSRYEPSPEEDDLESRLRQHFHTKVSLKKTARGGGSLTIFFYSDEELSDIAGKLGLDD